MSYGDTLKISVAADDFDKMGFDLFYQLELVEETGLVLAGRAKTGMLCFDYITKTKLPIPEEVVAELKRG